ncbi:MAG: hypothetical protein KIT89_09760 [Microcella sp.]|uniref:hypothetical protein n=1 Tax=Microcella sp. TaxID=1913979 RepID=UPI0024CCE9D7|nr:hypothetical protein [Microcella sp.]UYN82990.1 MAG: hypothetical protein KIT89_09760 [Microcella sp.]
MSTEPVSNEHDDADDDQLAPGWQPLLERPGYEQWWDGTDLRGRPHREPDPFSAFTPDLARSLRPGPNRAARLARIGIVATIAVFVLQTLTSTGLVALPGVDPLTVTLAALAIAALVAVLTALAAVLALRAAPQLGGRAIATLALGVSIILGLAPVLLLVAIGLAGGL